MDTNGTLPAYRSALPVAVDTQGGDEGMGVVVEGAVRAYIESGVNSILVGKKDEIKNKLESLGASRFPLSVYHAPDVITMEDSPARAVRRKPDSSLCVAYNLLRDGQASAVISAGNSGAMMVAGSLICGLMPGIERPAIGSLIPVVGDGYPNVILDCGANVDCNAHNLVQFAVMGAIYFTSLTEVERPRVALLSNGSEPSKGNDMIRAAALALSSLENINYVGYVEGRDFGTRKVDVVVCDGFVGNVVLKAMEGSVRMVFDQLILESKKGLVRRVGIGLSKGMLKEVFQEKFDYAAYGGAPLLGLSKLALVLHGSSDSRAVKNAIRVADTFSRNRMTEKIQSELSHLEDEALNIEGELVAEVLVQRPSQFALKKAVKRTAKSEAVSAVKGSDTSSEASESVANDEGVEEYSDTEKR